MTELPLGSSVGGVRLDEVLGRGGMGIVYRGYDESLKRPVAVKVLREGLAESDEARKRFRRECETAASLEHPHIVRVYAAGEEDGRLYVVMQLVEGHDMRRLLSERGAPPPGDAVRVVGQVGRALDYTHGRGLVHRDVKPANILVATVDGELHAYLGDFGLTRVTEDSHGITTPGTLLGTLDYMAPEQYGAGPTDWRADVYALGCVLHEALTGTQPFPRDSSAAKMWAHVNEAPPRPSAGTGVPTGLDDVVARALAKKAEDRYRRAGDVGHAAAAALQTAAAAPTVVPGRTVEANQSGDGSTAVLSAPNRAPHVRWPENGDSRDIPRQRVPDSGPLSTPPPVPPPPPSPPDPTPAPKPRSRRWWLVGAPVAALVVVAAVVAGIALTGGPDPVPTPPATRVAGTVVGAPVAVGREPLDIVSGDGFLWTANASDASITQIDPRSGTTRRIYVDGKPNGVVVAQGVAWVWNWNDEITRVDVRTGALSWVPIGPAGISAIALDGGYVWVSQSAANNVVRISTATSAVVGAPIAVGKAPVSLAADNGTVFVANTGDRSVSAIDVATGTVGGTPLRLSQDVFSVDARNGVLYVAVGNANAPLDQADGSLLTFDEYTYAVGNRLSFDRAVAYWGIEAGRVLTAAPLPDELVTLDPRTFARTGEPVRGVSKNFVDAVGVGDDLWVADRVASTVTRVHLTP